MTHDLGLPRPDSRLLETDRGTPPAEPTPVSQQGLPEDLLREATQRLAYTALISGGLWLANWLAVHFIHPLPARSGAKSWRFTPGGSRCSTGLGVRPFSPR